MHAALLIIALVSANGNPDNWCRNGLFPTMSDDYRVATVRGEPGSKAYFWKDEGECPKVGGDACVRKAYLIPGDRVLVSTTFGDWRCAWYQPKKGSETVGWIRSDRLLESSVKTPPLSAWLGTWRGWSNEISLRKHPSGGLEVEGTATWDGGNGNIHVGELSGSAVPDGMVLKLGEGGEYDCAATLRLVGEMLVVSDNLRCGGANVSFNGVYVRR